jgi:hypothetical protein
MRNILARGIGEAAIQIGEVLVGQKCRRNKKHPFWLAEWEFFHFGKHGRLLRQWMRENTLLDEGEQMILDIAFRAAAQGSFYLGLANDTPLETDTLADLAGEPVGNGYARQALARNTTDWPVLALDSGDYRVISKLATFMAAGGSIGPVTMMFLCDAASGTVGKYIAWAALSETITLGDAESLGCKIRVKLM